MQINNLTKMRTLHVLYAPKLFESCSMPSTLFVLKKLKGKFIQKCKPIIYSFSCFPNLNDILKIALTVAHTMKVTRVQNNFDCFI